MWHSGSCSQQHNKKYGDTYGLHSVREIRWKLYTGNKQQFLWKLISLTKLCITSRASYMQCIVYNLRKWFTSTKKKLVRVHVERAIERVKNYRILQSVFQLSMAPYLNKIWVICSYLIIFLPQLIPHKDEWNKKIWYTIYGTSFMV